MRLIDAKEAEKLAKSLFTDKPVLLGWVLRLIRQIPTIDAVPVVRCKDCKHGKTWENAWGIEGFKCDLLCVDLSPEAFCSYGVRKDGANDG